MATEITAALPFEVVARRIADPRDAARQMCWDALAGKDGWASQSTSVGKGLVIIKSGSYEFEAWWSPEQLEGAARLLMNCAKATREATEAK